MSGVAPPEFFADLRVTVRDAQVEYRFSNPPEYRITLIGQISQQRRSLFEPGLPIEIIFDTGFGTKALIAGEQRATLSCATAALDTGKLVSLIQIAQTQQSGLMADIDIGHAAKADHPNYWYVTDVGLVLPNILV